MLVRVVLVVPALFLLTLQDAGEEKAKKDLAKLQGTWTMAALEVNGKDVPLDKLQGTTLTVKGHDYRVKVRDKTLSCTIRLDPAKDPRAIDMTFTEKGSPDKLHKGIYKVDGDTFTIARGLNPEQERPNQFATWPDTNYFVVTWKRQPK